MKKVVLLVVGIVLLLGVINFVSAVDYNCTDSDGGINYYIKGTRTSIMGEENDACRASEAVSAPNILEGRYLLELYCEGEFDIGAELYECPGGCYDGACEPSCVDTDNGVDYFERGTVTVVAEYTNWSEENFIDYCRTGYLTEFSCITSDVYGVAESASEYPCPNGCIDGACIEGNENIERKIAIAPNIVSDGDIVSVSVQIPSFMDCNSSIVNPFGREKQDGSGGCRMVGQVHAFSTIRLEQLFGSPLEEGVYTYNLVLYNGEFDDFNLTSRFFFVGDKDCENINSCVSFRNENPPFYIREEEVYDEEGTYTVSGGETFIINNIEIKVEEVAWSLQPDTRPYVWITGRGVSKILREAESYIFLFGAVTSPISENLKVTIKEISINEEIPEESTAIIELVEINNIINPTSETGPLDVPEDDGGGNIYGCNGCQLNEICYPLGYRKSGEYCSDSLEFVSQLNGGVACDNNFECSSNLCIDDSCVEAGFFQKIINWFKRVFAGG